MKKQVLSEELKRMNKLAGLMNENIDEARWQNDPWADIETGGEHSKSIERRKSSYDRQKENDNLGSATFQYFTNKIKKLGTLMTDEEAVNMMDEMKDALTSEEIMDVYNFLDSNNISSPIYTYLDQYKGETGSYGLEENGGFDIEKTKQPVDLSSVDPHTLEQIKKQLLARNGEMPTDEEIRNVVSVMVNEEALEEAQDSEDVMIKEGKLGRTIARILKEEMLKK